MPAPPLASRPVTALECAMLLALAGMALIGLGLAAIDGRPWRAAARRKGGPAA